MASWEGRIQNEHAVAVTLLTEIWMCMPSLFSNKQHRSSMLQHEVDQDDFGLKDRLSSKENAIESTKGLLGSKVLSLFTKIAKDAALTTKVLMCTRLFYVLERLLAEFDDFSDNVYKLLIFFLIEWHENKVLRNHLMTNFIELYKNDKVLSVSKLVEPLCSIVTQNLKAKDGGSEEGPPRTYVTLADFSFLWSIANMP